MARIARVVIPGMPHHVTHRGNNREDIFFSSEDRETYLKHLRVQSVKYGLRIEGYCLMSNHVHVIATPTKDDSLAKAIGRAHHLYAVYLNQCQERSGHVWENRFYSATMDNAYFMLGLRYVEMNPVRAGIVEHPWSYDWSSAKEHIDGFTINTILDSRRWKDNDLGRGWKKFVSGHDPDGERKLREATKRGRPFALSKTVEKLEARLGRSLRPPKMGPPRKNRK